MTTADISFRPADPADAACLSALGTQLFFETYATSGIRMALVREAAWQFSVSTFVERPRRPEGRTTLAERDGHLIAFAEVVLGAQHPLVARAPMPRSSPGSTCSRRFCAGASGAAFWRTPKPALQPYALPLTRCASRAALTIDPQSIVNTAQ